MPDLPERLSVRPDIELRTGPESVPARDAATVALLRERHDQLQVFLQQRVTGMAFAGGMTVFPGGGVDRRDEDVSVAWSGPGPEWWAQRFDCDSPLARALVCAAVRETFEECGVLLAGQDPETAVDDASRYADARAALESRELSLAAFLADAGLVLRADLLRPWSNWITPEEEPRRYDARFFLALLPEGQRADGATSEADLTGWVSPTKALTLWRAHEVGLLPPTWVTLTELEEFGSLAAAFGADRAIDKIMPKVIRERDGIRVVLPGDPRYADAPAHLEP